jgi:cob(I)alamin adenosyltransferase
MFCGQKRLVLPQESFKGLVQVFTGDGKGKTTAALGAVIRAIGRGLNVFIVYFLKGGQPSGENNVLSRMERVSQVSFGSGAFVDPERIKPEDIREAGRALAAAEEAISSGRYDLVVLDEINLAAAWRLVKLDDVISIVKGKPQHVELILTGRYADARLIELADLVTEMLNVKHPYTNGLKARCGIEY